MKIYKVGEKSKAICPFCHAEKETTFKERTVPLANGRGEVEGVLAAVCDGCDKVVATPQQSAIRIREVVQKTRRPLEVRIPRHLDDILNNSCEQIGLDMSEAGDLFRYYLKRIYSNQRLIHQVTKSAHSEEAKGRATARFSVKLSEKFHETFTSLAVQTGLDKSELVRGISLQMKHELLDKSATKTKKQIKDFFSHVG